MVLELLSRGRDRLKGSYNLNEKPKSKFSYGFQVYINDNSNELALKIVSTVRPFLSELLSTIRKKIHGQPIRKSFDFSRPFTMVGKNGNNGPDPYLTCMLRIWKDISKK